MMFVTHSKRLQRRLVGKYFEPGSRKQQLWFAYLVRRQRLSQQTPGDCQCQNWSLVLGPVLYLRRSACMASRFPFMENLALKRVSCRYQRVIDCRDEWFLACLCVCLCCVHEPTIVMLLSSTSGWPGGNAITLTSAVTTTVAPEVLMVVFGLEIALISRTKGESIIAGFYKDQPNCRFPVCIRLLHSSQ